jgi:hypothetical protein
MLNFLGREGEQMFRISDAFPAEESMTVLQPVNMSSNFSG